MKIWGKSSRGCSHGFPKIFRAPTYGVHCAVIFAIAQLSCMIYIYSKSYMLTSGRLEVCKHRFLVAWTQRASLKTGVDENHSFFIIKVGRRTINLIKIFIKHAFIYIIQFSSHSLHNFLARSLDCILCYN